MGRMAAVAAAAALLVGLVVVYVSDFLTAAPAAIAATATPTGARLRLETVPSYGHPPAADWVSYLGQNGSGRWIHTTQYRLPAHTVVTVTIYQFDTASGLRNPFFAQVRGTQGGTATLNGRPFSVANPDDVAHTFTVPDLGISVPLVGVNANAKNQCAAAACTLDEAHNTITFSFTTPGKGVYRWQCFVPCGLASIFGNGGPMQTLGWMSGDLVVT